MTFTEKNIIENYLGLFENLNSMSKLELIEKLTKSLKSENKSKESNFYKSFGAFSTEKSSDEIISDLKSSRKFRNKEIKF
jgi:ribosomal protein L20A (L18A)